MHEGADGVEEGLRWGKGGEEARVGNLNVGKKRGMFNAAENMNAGAPGRLWS